MVGRDDLAVKALRARDAVEIAVQAACGVRQEIDPVARGLQLAHQRRHVPHGPELLLPPGAAEVLGGRVQVLGQTREDRGQYLLHAQAAVECGPLGAREHLALEQRRVLTGIAETLDKAVGIPVDQDLSHVKYDVFNHFPLS